MNDSFYFLGEDGMYYYNGQPWDALSAEIRAVPMRPAELMDADRMPLGATWTLPPDYTLWQRLMLWKARWFA